MEPVRETMFLRSYLSNRPPDSLRASYIEDDISGDEREFLWLIRLGDLEGLKALLQVSKELNFNCCDYRGQRALDIAVSNDDAEILEYLLDELRVSPLHYYSAVLRAVLENESSMVEILLERADEDDELKNGLNNLLNHSPDCTRCLPEVASANLSPTMAAAINGNLEISRMLLERGYCVQKPHRTKCRCEEHCGQKIGAGETLTESINRINTYRALASPTYLLLTSEDPILSAFELSQELKCLSEDLPENQKEYIELATQCSQFAAGLLNECRNTEEVQIVLSQKKGFHDPRPHSFSRLHLAVHCGQKEFVTHASCQQVLRSMWVQGLGTWYTWTFRRKMLHVMKHAFLTPFISIAFILTPTANLLTPLKVPLNRFIYFATSYVFFLMLLLVTLLIDRRYNINSPATWTEISVCSFVIGHSWSIVLNLFSMGFTAFFRLWWSVFDLIMFSLFLAADFLWISVFVFKIMTSDDAHSNRMTWPWYHPILLGEGMYATASVMAFIKLLVWCHINSKLGPLGTSVRNMMGDVARFFVLFFIIMFAFATGLNSIYKNYKDAVSHAGGDETLEQPDAFVTLKSTFKSLFWAIFGMGEPDFAQIIVSTNITGLNLTEDELSSHVNDHMFTEGIGYGLWGLYHMITVIVLLNMLIAMMADSYQRVQCNADMEWKFACSSLWLSVFDSHNVVPVPFNLIPSMHKVTLLFRWILTKMLHNSDEKFSWSRNRCCYWDPEPNHTTRAAEEEQYEKLMIQLIRRYIHSKELKDSSPTSNLFMPADIKEKIKTEILQELQKSMRIPQRANTRRRTRRNQCNTIIK